METAQHWDRLAKNQPAEIAMFQISEVQESPAFNGRRSFLTLRLWPSLSETTKREILDTIRADIGETGTQTSAAAKTE